MLQEPSQYIVSHHYFSNTLKIHKNIDMLRKSLYIAFHELQRHYFKSLNGE